MSVVSTSQQTKQENFPKAKQKYIPSKACKTCLRQIASRTKNIHEKLRAPANYTQQEQTHCVDVVVLGQEEWRKSTRGNGKIRHSSLLCLIYNSVGKITEYIMNKFVCATGMFLYANEANSHISVPRLCRGSSTTTSWELGGD